MLCMNHFSVLCVTRVNFAGASFTRKHVKRAFQSVFLVNLFLSYYEYHIWITIKANQTKKIDFGNLLNDTLRNVCLSFVTRGIAWEIFPRFGVMHVRPASAHVLANIIYNSVLQRFLFWSPAWLSRYLFSIPYHSRRVTFTIFLIFDGPMSQTRTK